MQMDLHKWYTIPLSIDWTAHVLESFLEDPESNIETDPPNQTSHQAYRFAHLLNMNLWQADSIYITKEIGQIISHAARDLPDNATFNHRELITRYGFAFLEDPVLIGDWESEEEEAEFFSIKAISWFVEPILQYDPDQLAIGIFLFADNVTDVAFLQNSEIHELGGQPLSLVGFYVGVQDHNVPMGDDSIWFKVVRYLATMQIIAKQKIGTTLSERPERSTRKRTEKYFTDGDRYIKVITLRRKAKATQNHIDIEWSHRWIVKGHWKQHWYPKEKVHRPIYIMDHIKGPDDKPLRIADHRIWDFRR